MNKPATLKPIISLMDDALALSAKYGWYIFPALGKKSYKSAKHSDGVNWGMTRDWSK